jgi:hypothetical protein
LIISNLFLERPSTQAKRRKAAGNGVALSVPPIPACGKVACDANATFVIKASNCPKADKKKGRLINCGWSNSSDEIPQPTSILLGRNLRKNFDEASKQQKEELKEKEPSQEM